MLIKSHALENHVDNLEETSTALCKYRMKLNQAMYAFGVMSKKFLKFMALYQGIEANLEKIEVIRQMDALKIVNEV